MIPPWLLELAERKLGKGAVVSVDSNGWVAEHKDDQVKFFVRTCVRGKTRDSLVWFLEQMQDL